MQDDKLRDSIEREIKHLNYLMQDSLEYAKEEGDNLLGMANRNIYRLMINSYKRILEGTH
jgi:hypothetical protein